MSTDPKPTQRTPAALHIVGCTLLGETRTDAARDVDPQSREAET